VAAVVAGCSVVVVAAAAAVAFGAVVDPTVAARGWEQRAYLEAAAAASVAAVAVVVAVPCRLHQRDYSAVAACHALKASAEEVHCWGLVGSLGLAPSSVGAHCWPWRTEACCCHHWTSEGQQTTGSLVGVVAAEDCWVALGLEEVLDPTKVLEHREGRISSGYFHCLPHSQHRHCWWS